MAQGRFITLEGGEGAGKSTQARHLAEALNKAGIPTLITREPGGSAGAEAIRALVVSGAVDRWDARTESLLFMAARLDHVEQAIKPALARGEWVICDRFYDSTYVYQGIAKRVGTTWLDQLYSLLLGNFAPELTLWLDLEPAAGLARAGARGNVAESRFESMGIAYHEALRQGFAARASAWPERIMRINADQAVEAVGRDILSAINRRFATALI